MKKTVFNLITLCTLVIILSSCSQIEIINGKDIQKKQNIEQPSDNHAFNTEGADKKAGDNSMTDSPLKDDNGKASITPYKDSEYRTEYANVLDFDSAEGNPYFAVAFIGYGENLTEQRNDYVKSIFSSLDKSALEKTEHFDFEGDEWYLVVPRYKEYVDIKSLDGSKMYTVYGGEAFTVKCNVSDLHSNIEIVTDIHGGHIFSPQMGGDGRLIETEDVWDITFYCDKS